MYLIDLSTILCSQSDRPCCGATNDFKGTPDYATCFPQRVSMAETYRYEKPEDWSIVTVPVPEVRENDVLIKVKACVVCGTVCSRLNS